MKTTSFKALGFMLTISVIPPLYADPIGDSAILAKLAAQLKQLESQYQLLDKTYKTADAERKGIEQLNQFNSGHSGFGTWHNSLADVQKRMSANSWRETLKGVSGGNPERYKELIAAYEKQHANLNKPEFSQGASQARSQRFDDERQATQAASVESEAAFNDVNNSLKRIHELSEQIEKAENTKAAIDLNSRLLTELGYIQSQNLKAQAILNQQMAVKSGASLSDEAELSHYLARDKP